MKRAMAIVGVVLALVMGAVPVATQPGSKPRQAIPPDLSGTWGPRFVYALSPDPPMLPEARKRFKETSPDNDPLARCKPPGVPRVTNMAFPFEIVQTPMVVYILFEYDQHVRRIFIDGTHPADLEPTWLGHSIGRWEGQTLVVDTVGFVADTWLDMRGHLHSEKMRVVERFSRSPDRRTLTHEITIDDPTMYSKPWGMTKTHPLWTDQTIQEFICEVVE
jgi:hypothetical protein